jgi:hypothetical protein
MRAGAGTLCAAAIVLMAAAGEPAAAQGYQEFQGDVFSAACRVRCTTVWRMMSATSVLRGSCHGRHPRLSGAATWCGLAHSLFRDT